MKWLYTKKDLDSIDPKLKAHIENLLDTEVVHSDQLSDYFGGAVAITEEPSDLKDIHSEWADLTERPGSYDWCGWVCGKKYVELCLCTTNAGGDLFFIHKDHVNEHVLKSIDLS